MSQVSKTAFGVVVDNTFALLLMLSCSALDNAHRIAYLSNTASWGADGSRYTQTHTSRVRWSRGCIFRAATASLHYVGIRRARFAWCVESMSCHLEHNSSSPPRRVYAPPQGARWYAHVTHRTAPADTIHCYWSVKPRLAPSKRKLFTTSRVKCSFAVRDMLETLAERYIKCSA